MAVTRGEAWLADLAPTRGTEQSGVRPVLIVQSDAYNQRPGNTLVAQITTNLRHAKEPTHLLIEVGTPEGQQSGLLHDSVVSCINLATIEQSRIDRAIGSLPPSLMGRIDACLKVALGIP